MSACPRCANENTIVVRTHRMGDKAIRTRVCDPSQKKMRIVDGKFETFSKDGDTGCGLYYRTEERVFDVNVFDPETLKTIKVKPSIYKKFVLDWELERAPLPKQAKMDFNENK